MKITVNRDLLELVPETEEEWTQLESLWLKLIPSGTNVKGVRPLDSYPDRPGKSAYFRLEGLSLAEKNDMAQPRASRDLEVICPICGKTRRLRMGELIPRCCGRAMEPRRS